MRCRVTEGPADPLVWSDAILTYRKGRGLRKSAQWYGDARRVDKLRVALVCTVGLVFVKQACKGGERV